MAKFIIIKNGKTIVGGISEDVGEVRSKALALVNKFPQATFTVARLVRSISAEKTPPSYTVVEEDLDGVQ